MDVKASNVSFEFSQVPVQDSMLAQSGFRGITRSVTEGLLLFLRCSAAHR